MSTQTVVLTMPSGISASRVLSAIAQLAQQENCRVDGTHDGRRLALELRPVYRSQEARKCA